MKKHVLFGLAAFASLAMVAQNTHRTVLNAKMSSKKPFKNVSTRENHVAPATVQNKVNKKTGAPYKRIGGSNNAYTAQSPDARLIQYNEALNTVGFTYRKSDAWTGVTGGNSGTICFAYTSNNGSTWDSTIVAIGSTAYQQRHPTGTIYNPAANTNPANAYAVVSGPWHPGQDWQGSFFGSKQLSYPGTNTDGDVLYVDNLALSGSQRKQDFPRTDIQATSNGNIYVLGDLYGDINATTVAGQAWRGAMINKGVLSGTTFNWTLDSLKPSFKPDTETGDAHAYPSSNMAE